MLIYTKRCCFPCVGVQYVSEVSLKQRRNELTVNLRAQKIVKALMQIRKDSYFTTYMNSFRVFSLMKEKERFMGSRILSTYLCVPLSVFGSK